MPKAVGYDADAQAFITATGITDLTQKNAINQLVLDLKGYSIWTKMKALYPFVGGTATTHKFNLKNPLDTDAAFRLVFSGGWTHSATGALPNGTNTNANTFLTPSTSLTLNSSHLSYYSRTNANTAQIEIGVQTAGQYNLLEIRTSGITYPLINQSALTSFADPNSLGFYLGNRQGVTDVDGWKNGVKLVNGTQTSGSLPIHLLYLGVLNNNNTSFTNYSTKECAFSSIGDGLTDTDSANFYTAVQTFQTSLSRNV